jgi:hypothetical protein
VEQRRPVVLRSSVACSTWNVHEPPGPHVRICRQRPRMATPFKGGFDILTSPRPHVGSRCDSQVPAAPSTPVKVPASGFTECSGMAANAVTPVARLGGPSRNGDASATSLLEHGFSTFSGRGRRCRRDWAHSGRPQPFCIHPGRPAMERPVCICNDLDGESGPSRLPRGPIGGSGLRRQRPQRVSAPLLPSAGTDRRLPRLVARSAMARRGPRSICHDHAGRPDHRVRWRGGFDRCQAWPRASCAACPLSDSGREFASGDVRRSKDRS